jgi:hypothetical protein
MIEYPAKLDIAKNVVFLMGRSFQHSEIKSERRGGTAIDHFPDRLNRSSIVLHRSFEGGFQLSSLLPFSQRGNPAVQIKAGRNAEDDGDNIGDSVPHQSLPE